MVKVNENQHEDVHAHGPLSSMSSDGSFVVLERSPPQEPSSHFASHMSQQSMGPPPVPPHSNFPTDLPRLESQISQNSNLVPGSLPTDLSPEEIQRKLHEVLQENLELKETLHQNNLAMKQQFNTLAMWREEVFKVHQNHKVKFSETKELVLKLRAENAELKNILEEYKNAGSAIPSASETQLKMENVELKGKIAELQEKLLVPIPRKEQLQNTPSSKKEQELNSLLEQVNRQLETAERARRQLVVDLERVTAQKTRIERDMATQKNEVEKQKEQFQRAENDKEELEQKLIHLTKQYELVLLEQEHRQQFSSSPSNSYQPSTRELQRLVAQLDEQRALVNTLTHQLKEERAKVASLKGSPTSSMERGALAKDLKGCEQTLEHVSHCLDRDSERYNSLDSWLQVASNSVSHMSGKQTVDTRTVNTLNAEIQELRNLLYQEQALSQEKKHSLEEAQKMFQSLHTKYQSVLKELEDVEHKDRHNSAYHEVQARGFTEKIDSMTAQLLNKDEALVQKDKEMTQLKDTLKKLELENEAITILKAQVEVYQSDFNSEREARENLAGEKERLAEDLRHLQRRNQQLLDELEAYQQNQFEEMRRQGVTAIPSAPVGGTGWGTIATPGRERNQRTSPIRPSPIRISPGRTQLGRQQTPPPMEREEPPPRNDFGMKYYCPGCGKDFLSVKPLETHVVSCLNL